MIDRVDTAFVPATDQARAVEFYTEKLGFSKRLDIAYGGGRWVEVAPPDSTLTLALVPGGEGTTADRAATCCALSTRDIAATHRRLQDLGVAIDPDVGRHGGGRPGLVSPETSVSDPQPPQVIFRDPDGNRFLLAEVPAG